MRRATSRESRYMLTLHAYRGSSMKSKPVALMLTDLGITKTHSRPYTSNDNPYSEAQFKTLKYRPEFPARFGSIEDARFFCQVFFTWYNTIHRHSGIGYMTPESVHYGHAKQITESKQGSGDISWNYRTSSTRPPCSRRKME